ncbi:fungal-specific transcription factor domain-containing protein [Xylariomycetidae sp. FL2044]|nr:fungal-specific transcription factor domain-containing protein [Xylariomycetidae sp. FL2044]
MIEPQLDPSYPYPTRVAFALFDQPRRSGMPPSQPPPPPPPSALSYGIPSGRRAVSVVSPASASTAYASPDSSHHQHFYTTKSDPDDGSSTGSGSSITAVAPPFLEPARKKQKRNKPTLSCQECVERKTKCDRGRPHCLACIKRQTECCYAQVADLLEETSRSATNGRKMTKPPKKKLSMTSATKPSIPNIADRGILTSRTEWRGSVALSNVPFSLPTASNVFGIGSEHPFANYWTCEGGLPEVIGVLPDKLQADILLTQYFECVDPIYPMIHRQSFYADYDRFWSLPASERHRADASFIALIFVMLALGTQFVSSTKPKDRKQTAEFYASASNQALRVGSYLSMASIRSLQSMVLICYFLINDNHASDGFAFAGILMRQAYAMGLHRDPNIVTPDASQFEKQQRRKLWQAVLLQDTFFTVLLSLPPSATHNDVKIDDFSASAADIAGVDRNDIEYIRGSWTLANLVQETICSPRSLDMPICSTQRQKSKLVADFRAVYRAFPDNFRSWDPDSISQLVTTSSSGSSSSNCNGSSDNGSNNNKRLVRQTLFLTSNYYHNLMLVHASESPDVPVNVRATLEAAHEAITAFFVLFTLFETEARVWWVFNHRAFLEALCIGSVLREVTMSGGVGSHQYKGLGVLGAAGESEQKVHQQFARDPLFTRARADITRMVQIMKIMGEGEQGSEVARTRVTVLSEFL